MALGATLRAERERRGLTEHQVAEATRMMVQMVREIEEEDFHRIAAAIYGRGFVKLYASHLGLDPVPLVREFEELYARRSTRPEPSPRVPLQRFGDAPGDGLQSVTPEPAPAAQSPAAPEPAPVRIPAPHSIRAAVSVPPPGPAAPGASDLFGDPLKPVAEDGEGRVLALPRRPGGDGAAVRGAAETPKAVTRRSVLDSASHRFDGHPFQPGPGRVLGVWLGRAVQGLAVVLTGLGTLLARAGRVLAARSRLAGQRLRRLPWRRIGRVAAAVVPVILLLWGAAAGFQSCVRRRAEARAAASPAPSEAVVVERILPPPAGYADF